MIGTVPWCGKKAPIDDDFIRQQTLGCLESGTFSNYGPNTAMLEAKLAEILKIDNSKSIVCCASGTAALWCLVAAYDSPRCVTQAYTFYSSKIGVLKDSIVVDNDPIHFGPSILHMTTIIDDFDAIIVTNPFGLVVDIEKYIQFAQDNKKYLFFDNAATPYAFDNSNSNVCCYGDGSIISLHETKAIGRGEGGAIIFPKQMRDKVIAASNFGVSKGLCGCDSKIADSGNYRMGELQAIYILDRLNSFDFELAVRSAQTILKTFPNLVIPHRNISRTVLSCIPVCFESRQKRDAVYANAQKEGICVRIYYHPLPLQGGEIAAFATEMYEKTLCFPIRNENIQELQYLLQRYLKACNTNTIEICLFPSSTRVALEYKRSFAGLKNVNIICAAEEGEEKEDKLFYKVPNMQTEVECIEALVSISQEHPGVIFAGCNDDAALFLQQHKFLSLTTSPYFKDLRLKRETYSLLLSQGIISERKDNRITIPAFVKPNKGNASRGCRVVATEEELNEYLQDEDYVSMELLKGKEFTVDCVSKKGIVMAYCRERVSTLDGMSSVTKTASDKDQCYAFQKASEISTKLKIEGCWFFQYKYATLEGEEPVILEIALRVGGASGLSRSAGLNCAKIAILDDKINPDLLCKDKLIYYSEEDRATEIYEDEGKECEEHCDNNGGGGGGGGEPAIVASINPSLIGHKRQKYFEDEFKEIRQNVLSGQNYLKKIISTPMTCIEVAPDEHDSVKYFGWNSYRSLGLKPPNDIIADITIGSGKIPKADVYVCCEVIEHTSDPIAAFETLASSFTNYLLISIPMTFEIHGPYPDSFRFTPHAWKVLAERYGLVLLWQRVIHRKNCALLPIHSIALFGK